MSMHFCPALFCADVSTGGKKEDVSWWPFHFYEISNFPPIFFFPSLPTSLRIPPLFYTAVSPSEVALPNPLLHNQSYESVLWVLPFSPRLSLSGMILSASSKSSVYSTLLIESHYNLSSPPTLSVGTWLSSLLRGNLKVYVLPTRITGVPGWLSQ